MSQFDATTTCPANLNLPEVLPLLRFIRETDGAVTADWVVLTALAVTLLSAGWGSLRDGTTSLASDTSEYMTTYRD